MKFLGIAAALCASVTLWAQNNSASVLDYVDGSALWIAYGNSKAVFQHKLWQVAIKIARQAGEYNNIMDDINRNYGIMPEELAGEVAVWGDEKGVRNIVFKLENKNAHTIFDKFARVQKMRCKHSSYRFAVEEFKNGNRIFICGYKGKDYSSVRVSLLCNSNDVLQIFVAEKPDTALMPRRSNSLINKIARTRIASGVVSQHLFRRLVEKDQDLRKVFPYGIPQVGDLIVSLDADTNRVRVEAEVDISRVN